MNVLVGTTTDKLCCGNNDSLFSVFVVDWSLAQYQISSSRLLFLSLSKGIYLGPFVWQTWEFTADAFACYTWTHWWVHVVRKNLQCKFYGLLYNHFSKKASRKCNVCKLIISSYYLMLTQMTSSKKNSVPKSIIFEFPLNLLSMILISIDTWV